MEIALAEKHIHFDKNKFLIDLSAGAGMIDQAVQMGESFANDGVHRLLMVGCGAPHYMFRAINTWIGYESNAGSTAVIYPGDMMHARYLPDENTAIIFGSHSGKTTETVQAARSLNDKKGKSIAITQHKDSPLGENVQEVLAYGSTEQGYFTSVMLTLAMVSGFLKNTSSSWNLHEKLIASLRSLPEALAAAKQSSISIGIENANTLQNASALHVIGNGPMYTTAYVFAACFLMEMQRMHAHPMHALDFFHGPFEMMDDASRIILLKGEGIFRPDSERVRQFCDNYLGGGCLVYDSKTFAMPGIDPKIRPIAAPFVVDAAMTNLVEQLAILRAHPLDTRRYMGKVDY